MSIQELQWFLESFWDRGKCGCFGRGHGRQGVVETQGCIEIISHSLQIGKSEVDSWHQSHGSWVSMDWVIRVAKRCSCREAGSFCNHEIADLILHHMGTLLCKIFFFRFHAVTASPVSKCLASLVSGTSWNERAAWSQENLGQVQPDDSQSTWCTGKGYGVYMCVWLGQSLDPWIRMSWSRLDIDRIHGTGILI